MMWGIVAEFPAGFHVSPELRILWRMYPLCFLRLWMASESLLGPLRLILWTLRENYSQRNDTINNNISVTGQMSTGMFAFYGWFNSAVVCILGISFKVSESKPKMGTDREQKTILLWEYCNMKLYKQTGSWQCGGAWEMCELALVLQPQGRYGMRLGCKDVWGGMFVVRYIVKSCCLDSSLTPLTQGGPL